MIDPCQLDPLMCQNNGECAINISSNMTYCQCDQCHYGILCENDVWRESSTHPHPHETIILESDCSSISKIILRTNDTLSTFYTKMLN